MILFDTHCHLNAENFNDDVEGYLARAKQNGVNYFAVIAWDLASSKRALALAEQHDGVFAVVGIHPSDCFNAKSEDLLELEPLLAHPKTVALGEIGLDYYWHKQTSEHDIQKEWFIRQIEMANKYDKPIVVHNRDATQETLDLLKKHRVKQGGIMHCFSSSSEMANEFIKLGFYIGLGGPVTFKNAKEPKRVAREIPLNRLVIETDSPYLAPHPNRGKQNESSYLPLIFEEVVKIREIEAETLQEILLENSENVFHVKL